MELMVPLIEIAGCAQDYVIARVSNVVLRKVIATRFAGIGEVEVNGISTDSVELACADPDVAVARRAGRIRRADGRIEPTPCEGQGIRW